MEYKNETIHIQFDDAANRLKFSGRLRAQDNSVFYAINELLQKVNELHRSSLIIDVRSLEDINSSGLGILYRFAASKRDNGNYSLHIKANQKILWQEKRLTNLKTFLPSTVLSFS
ncbi:Hypothetical protein HDN1F_12180 [gamma proteobacterium HdN1]|nr:Hypothetical protein HDN1F_12180 [gamma proteobacterium HdN1]